jgi:hypothetical protein
VEHLQLTVKSSEANRKLIFFSADELDMTIPLLMANIRIRTMSLYPLTKDAQYKQDLPRLTQSPRCAELLRE